MLHNTVLNTGVISQTLISRNMLLTCFIVVLSLGVDTSVLHSASQVLIVCQIPVYKIKVALLPDPWINILVGRKPFITGALSQMPWDSGGTYEPSSWIATPWKGTSLCERWQERDGRCYVTGRGNEVIRLWKDWSNRHDEFCHSFIPTLTAVANKTEQQKYTASDNPTECA